MKIIFLDIDGVLNCRSTKTRREDGYKFVDDDKILLLKELVDKTGARLVLSSSWRAGWQDADNGDITTDNAKGFIMFREKLAEYGLELMDYTPYADPEYRGETIGKWLNSWSGEEIESFVILDDYNDISPYGNFFLQTSRETGITIGVVRMGVKMLSEIKYASWKKKHLQKKENKK